MSVTMPVTIIGGYLGSGKTTLVNHLLRNANGVRLAVLVNDFGDLPIDADLIEAQEGDVISLSGGCVCCSYGDDLSSALLQLQSGTDQPDHIFIEASGVALPGAIGSMVSLLRDYQLEAIVVLADASTVIEHASAKYISDTIDRQLSDADLIVLNKLDLLTGEQINSVQKWIGERYSHAPCVNATQSKLTPELFFKTKESDGQKHEVKRLDAEPINSPRNHVTDSSDHRHDASIFATFRIKLEAKVDARQLAATLADKQCAVVRAKGFVLDATGEMKTIQVVGRRWSVTSAPENAKIGLVCIGISGVMSEKLVKSICIPVISEFV